MNFQAHNDTVYTLVLKCLNGAAVEQAFPGGSNLTAVSSNPASLGVSTLQSPAAVVLIPKVQNSPGITVTVTGTALAPDVLVVDVIPDPNLLSIKIDTNVADGATAAQNVPVAPGP